MRDEKKMGGKKIGTRELNTSDSHFLSRHLLSLFIGDRNRPEFRDARKSLEAIGPVTNHADPAMAATALANGASQPDVIVIAQSYPGQYSIQAIDRLRSVAPLARVIALLGSLCEGEMRSGCPWPGVIRVYWHQWPGRGERELRKLVEGRGSAWTLPVTATEEERLLATADEPLPKRQGLLVIYTPRAAAEDWLSAACRACGYSTVWLRPPSPPRIQGTVAAIFDGTDFGDEELACLRRLCLALASTPVIALADFPRIEDRVRILSAGAAAMLSKPVMLDDLWWELEKMQS